MPTKSDTPLAGIDTGYAQGDLRKPQWAGDKPIAGWDTETSAGEVFAMSLAHESLGWRKVVHNEGKAIDPSRIFQWLTRPAFQPCINVWFNLKFDASVILSVLPETALETLHITNSVEWTDGRGKDYRITYIPGKLLRFQMEPEELESGHITWHQSVDHFDVAQIFQDNLQGAATEWLGKGKLGGVDTSQFDDSEYVRQHYDTILSYAKQDAVITMELGRALIDQAEAIGIPAARPISTGYLAEQYMRETLDRKPGWALNSMQSMAWDSYAGGRFEVFERGHIGPVAGPDINSAYPAVLAGLPDPQSLRWGVLDQPDYETLTQADYGFVDVTVTTDPDRRIQPFAVKHNDLVTFPALNNHRLTVLLPTFLHALEEGVVIDYVVHKASVGYTTPHTDYPFEWVSELYDRRKRWESEGRTQAAKMLKIILNSLYGKMAQTTIKHEILEGGTDPADVETLTQALGYSLSESQRAGAMFNPFLASYITGLTRLQLHRAVLQADLEEDTVLFATDSIMIREPAYSESDFDSLLGDTLGEWDFDYRGDAFIVGSGVYEVRRSDLLPQQFDSYSSLNSKLTKTVSRGFRERDMDTSIRQAAEASTGNTVPIRQERPWTIGEALYRNDKISLSDVGRFEERTRELTAGFDKKRQWPVSDPTFADLLGGVEVSKPLVLE